MGSYWLYLLATSCGEIQVMMPNDVAPTLNIGDKAGLDWADDASRLLPAVPGSRESA